MALRLFNYMTNTPEPPIVSSFDETAIANATNLGSLHDGSVFYPEHYCYNCDARPVHGVVKFFRCSACQVTYCSPACQKEHWPSHRPSCKIFEGYNALALELTGNPRGWKDFLSWISFHYAAFANAAIAAMDLSENPGLHEHFALVVNAVYADRPSDPVQKRFDLKSVTVVDFRRVGHVPGLEHLRNIQNQRSAHSIAHQRNRIIGHVTIAVHGDFKGKMLAHTDFFGVDKWVARAKPNPDWAEQLFKYVVQGKKMKP
ncbi:hypothetical protein DENSPDRAFT_170703 [Dentipellis sp. KUC8613]|nr:hypothetical protein DENSPDRAFT_170703 [Dentipellis sp. KUC8613]